MGRNTALKVPQMKRAAELYLDGHSRQQLAVLFKVSEGAVRTALSLQGVQMRDRAEAATATTKRKARERQMRVSAFRPAHTELGRWVWVHPANADKWLNQEQA